MRLIALVVILAALYWTRRPLVCAIAYVSALAAVSLFIDHASVVAIAKTAIIVCPLVFGYFYLLLRLRGTWSWWSVLIIGLGLGIV